MAEVILIVLVIGLGAELAWGAKVAWGWHQDFKHLVVEAVADAIKLQDDRIRKKLERSSATDEGQAVDVPRTGLNDIRAGQPLGR